MDAQVLSKGQGKGKGKGEEDTGPGKGNGQRTNFGTGQEIGKVGTTIFLDASLRKNSFQKYGPKHSICILWALFKYFFSK